MCKTVAVVFLAALGAASAGPCSPAVDTCTKLSDGMYCPVNDVQEHADINRDVAKISTLLKETPPNWAAAKTLYESGEFSSKGGSTMRTLTGLANKDMVAAGHTNAWYTGSIDLYGSKENIWHDFIVKCLDNSGQCAGKSDKFRKYVINKMLIGVVTGYATYEMGVAVTKAQAGLLSDAQAPYYWDEAAAFYIGNVDPLVGDGYTGGAPGNLYSPYEFNWKRDKDFPDGLNTHELAVKVLNKGLLSLRSNPAAISDVIAAQTTMYKIFAIAAIRSAIKYSWKATDKEYYVAEGAAYWRTASGYISTVSTAVKALVEEVDELLDMSAGGVLAADIPCQVKTKVEAMYKDLGITCEMVGTWKDATGCLATACNDNGATDSLIQGDTAYVDMCKAPTNTPAPTPAEDVSAAPFAHDRSFCAVPALAAVASWAA